MNNSRRAEETIRANARLLVDKFRSVSDLGIRFGYNRESIEWVQGFIERERNTRNSSSNIPETLIQVIGSYLGECVVHTYGGAWREHEGTWGVFFDDSNAVFPFNKVRKQFENGLSAGDSILGFYDVIGPAILHKS